MVNSGFSLGLSRGIFSIQSPKVVDPDALVDDDTPLGFSEFGRELPPSAYPKGYDTAPVIKELQDCMLNDLGGEEKPSGALGELISDAAWHTEISAHDHENYARELLTWYAEQDCVHDHVLSSIMAIEGDNTGVMFTAMGEKSKQCLAVDKEVVAHAQAVAKVFVKIGDAIRDTRKIIQDHAYEVEYEARACEVNRRFKTAYNRREEGKTQINAYGSELDQTIDQLTAQISEPNLTLGVNHD